MDGQPPPLRDCETCNRPRTMVYIGSFSDANEMATLQDLCMSYILDADHAGEQDQAGADATDTPSVAHADTTYIPSPAPSSTEADNQSENADARKSTDRPVS